MKKLKSLAIAVCMAYTLFTLVVAPVSLLTGCSKGTLTPTAESIAYQTLYAIGHAVDVADKAYLDLVVTRKISSSQLATVSSDYNTFQVAYTAALIVAQGNTNAIAPMSLVNQGNAFIVSVQGAK